MRHVTTQIPLSPPTVHYSSYGLISPNLALEPLTNPCLFLHVRFARRGYGRPLCLLPALALPTRCSPNSLSVTGFFFYTRFATGLWGGM
jgi:hypothetical protein